MAMFSEAKVGEKVWSLIDGWGEIISIGENSALPIRVQHRRTVATYNFEGKEILGDINPTLLWDEVKIVPPKRPNRCKECDDKLFKDYTVCYECLVKEKQEKREKCEACERVFKYSFPQGSVAELHLLDIVWLLDKPENHTCEKGGERIK